MEINLYRMTSAKNAINKAKTSVSTLSGTLKDSTSITDPVILIESGSVPNCNYMYIPDFGRYYFISDIVNKRANLYEISAHVDVLESFKSGILSNSAVLEDTQNTALDNYVANDVWKTKVKRKTDIVSFPDGLLENGEYILITAGGIAAI